MKQDPLIRRARASEADLLSRLALRSKAHWGYDDAFIEACRAELSVDASQLDDDGFYCFVAEVGEYPGATAAPVRDYSAPSRRRLRMNA